MTFWQNTWSNMLGGIGAGLFLLSGYIAVQWFLRATDLVVSYAWKYSVQDGAFIAWPAFDIRNRSRSKSYRLGNIAYTRAGKMFWVESKSIMGIVLEPGSMNFIEGAPVYGIHDLASAIELEVTIRDQSSRSFWLRGQGPGQQGKSWARRNAFKLRDSLEKWLIPLE